MSQKNLTGGLCGYCARHLPAVVVSAEIKDYNESDRLNQTVTILMYFCGPVCVDNEIRRRVKDHEHRIAREREHREEKKFRDEMHNRAHRDVIVFRLSEMLKRIQQLRGSV